MDYAARARALVGARFRPQGRDRGALDCVGLALRTYDVPATEVRRNYRLRGDHRAEVVHVLEQHFRKIPPRQIRTGDLLLMTVAADQLHIGVKTDAGFVHAHAGIGRVVETPGSPEWPVLGAYRKRVRVRSK